MIRVGFGFDVHQLVAGRELWLGGVLIPHSVGALGHSDADVLLHALCDALLGAAALGDIGQHFPNTDARWKGADSKVLLAEVMRLLREGQWIVGNVDCTLIMERPKIMPHVPAMRAVIAPLLGIGEDAVSIKATTSETMGYIGREEGVAAHAVALLQKA
ncbi:MAG: 2-C-methyl-D-erythritol 2,4-cyclodiphosphate synthase [Flavobacteriales bacterium]|jgi:2-C-methyl-D-erythritol 2,4-cyclodiphosphate synthase|nr:2-C-methyl-D-erythritol 2,4-cyclodiphosphate synthase [Flavobacteriales bacterium]MBK6549758.1 2-C-methyl-D-erythritol 2,4-cyclodiphosphate synthase [Flavobacteriales bacterium]MBK6883554.1 2-C-methyl-D-erythritol 2,4-cyclodiphosphate synthase [Flavobacteriales bacterium]MBK7102274.1 2-C-methyl-D-erythritol 2,4-cyclodiphosphate synthase [Flavobacteriales bacterium]MBK7113013.1 2-C-methyl-D-erythritol 2,4-cyclodiphosphate synthase [Flavobacteriales bacterium]